ncbi:hypothetical protein TBR22_A20060 [Luteitalea sp. TBR-22]|uniref:DUF3037 domain-containing protein n=1 Tax=Luteitalea sp. TBR-22 TaxID=2802971 RepID=UPI001AF1273C|nr:DUF3037 domain-containing protein [Luteitalea sp. TBR-22]BCS32784.1 hypothetical protein TBR22_A20060 [Luteitalea sp. TBR-22]
MRDGHAYDYAVIRVVPLVAREEFVNAGVIVSCPTLRFLDTRIALDEARLLALSPGVDLEAVRSHLAAFEAVARGHDDAGPIGELPPRQRFHWLVAPRSTVIQTSPAHTGWCRDPAITIDRLLRQYVG